MAALLIRSSMLSAVRAAQIRAYSSSCTQSRLWVLQCQLLPMRHASTNKAPSNTPNGAAKLSVVQNNAEVSTVTQRVISAGKTTSYFLIVVAGLGVTGTILLFIFRELFSKDTPSGVYDDAVKRCRQNEDIRRVFGEPIRAYGEETGRGRRRYTAHTLWLDESGRKHMLMRFYLAGPSQRGVVHLEVQERTDGEAPAQGVTNAQTNAGNSVWNTPVLAYLRGALRRTDWQYRYLVVETTAAHARQIRIEPPPAETQFNFGLSNDSRRR